MKKLSSLFIPSDFNNFQKHDSLYKYIHAKVFVILGLPITAFYIIYHFYYSRYIDSCLVLVMFLSLCCFLYDFMKKPEFRKPNLFQEITIRVFLIFFILSQFYYLWIYQNLGSTPWILIFPLLFLFSTNIKEALIWLFIITTIFFYFLFVTDLLSNPDEILKYKQRLFLVYLVMVSASIIISSIVRATMQKLFDNAKVMEAVNLRLEKEINEHKQVEETLQKNEDIFRLVSENANDVIWTIDMDLNYTYISPTIEKIQGWNAEEAAALTINDVLTPPSMKIAIKFIAANQTLGAKTGKYNISERLELELYCKDGTTIWTEISVSFIIGENGKPIGILGVTRDITERKKLETRLHRAHQMEAIGTLAGGVAHDLNNILSAQVGYPDLILMDLPEDSLLKEPILTIQKSGQKAAAIVQDLLTLARRGVVATEIVNLNNIVDDYLKSPECRNMLDFHSGVKINCDLEPYLLNIMGSSVHMATALTNISINAAEAMPGGGNISISTRNKYIDKPVRGYEDIKEGDYVILTISDNGAGISSTDIEKIFEPFYTKKVMGRSGSGLGMAVVWGTVKDHKGYIEIQSTEGEETIFTLYFPVTRQEMEEKEKPLLIKAYMGEGESVLVVDDIEEQRDIASRMLRKLNYSVTTVSSGEEAIEYLKKNSADLLVLDMIMDPGIDGLETYQKILELHPGQQAIIASGFSETEMVKESQRLGAGKYLKKPYTIEKIGLAAKEEFEKLR